MREWFFDTVERTIATYVQAVTGLLTASAIGLVDISLWKTALVGGLPAALAVVKGALASKYGELSASFRRGDAPYAGREHP